MNAARVILIEGLPGSGKTSLAEWLCRAARPRGCPEDPVVESPVCDALRSQRGRSTRAAEAPPAEAESMIRFMASALIAALALFATLFGLSRAVGPGSPADAVIVGQIELIAEKLADATEPAKEVRRPPPRPQIEPTSR